MKVIDTVPMDDFVTHVAFTPDGKHALATKFNAHKVSLLDVSGDKVTYTKLDLPTGLWPYNVAVAPSGKIALTANAGNAGTQMAVSIRSTSSISKRNRRASLIG